jgi:hypothetical protein
VVTADEGNADDAGLEVADQGHYLGLRGGACCVALRWRAAVTPPADWR